MDFPSFQSVIDGASDRNGDGRIGICLRPGLTISNPEDNPSDWIHIQRDNVHIAGASCKPAHIDSHAIAGYMTAIAFRVEAVAGFGLSDLEISTAGSVYAIELWASQGVSLDNLDIVSFGDAGGITAFYAQFDQITNIDIEMLTDEPYSPEGGLTLSHCSAGMVSGITIKASQGGWTRGVDLSGDVGELSNVTIDISGPSPVGVIVGSTGTLSAVDVIDGLNVTLGGYNESGLLINSADVKSISKVTIDGATYGVEVINGAIVKDFSGLDVSNATWSMRVVSGSRIDLLQAFKLRGSLIGLDLTTPGNGEIGLLLDGVISAPVCINGIQYVGETTHVDCLETHTIERTAWPGW